MISDEMLNKIFEKNIEEIEEKIQKKYHYKIKQLKMEKEEKENAKLSIISELYYQQGFKDGINYIIKILDKK